mmetsp:Transcript_42489/g.88868  ORF Transcript_42489/g.88868 Transcript_42489/m.88868 type:complete len:114 (+) Transcript_42489:926-1267(+)
MTCISGATPWVRRALLRSAQPSMVSLAWLDCESWALEATASTMLQRPICGRPSSTTVLFESTTSSTGSLRRKVAQPRCTILRSGFYFEDLFIYLFFEISKDFSEYTNGDEFGS